MTGREINLILIKVRPDQDLFLSSLSLSPSDDMDASSKDTGELSPSQWGVVPSLLALKVAWLRGFRVGGKLASGVGRESVVLHNQLEKSDLRICTRPS